MEEPKRRSVFVDTSEFVSSNFEVEKGALGALPSLRKHHGVRLVMTDITLREISARLDKSTRDAESALQSARTKARVLRNTATPEFASLFDEPNIKDARTRIQSQIDRWITRMRAELLPTSRIDSSAVFESYFRGEPPFDGQKKKAEFPDAFVLEALRAWAAEHGVLYVVSRDGDFRRTCESIEQLRYVESLATFVNEVLDEDEAIAQQINDLLEHALPAIEGEVREKLDHHWVVLEDSPQDGELTEIEDLSIRETSYLGTTDGFAEFDLVFDLTFSALAPLPSSWRGRTERRSWDGEGGETASVHRASVQLHVSVELSPSAVVPPIVRFAANAAEALSIRFDETLTDYV